jgi:hypothetical protein
VCVLASDEKWYSLIIDTAQQLTFSTCYEETNFDSMIHVLHSNGVQIAYNDDHSGASTDACRDDAAVLTVNLPPVRNYFLHDRSSAMKYLLFSKIAFII